MTKIRRYDNMDPVTLEAWEESLEKNGYMLLMPGDTIQNGDYIFDDTCQPPWRPMTNIQGGVVGSSFRLICRRFVNLTNDPFDKWTDKEGDWDEDTPIRDSWKWFCEKMQ